VAEQRLHSALAPIDILTRVELDETLHKNFNAAERTWVMGLELQQFPRTIITATAATQPLGAIGNDPTPIGPEQGDIWMIRRVIVKSNVFGDTAKYLLFRGPTPSDVQNGYGMVQLLDAFTAAGAGQPVGVGFYPGTKSIYLQPGQQIYAQVTGATVNNQYQLDGEAIRCPAEMKGKLL
jgi:hypothetical protein